MQLVHSKAPIQVQGSMTETLVLIPGLLCTARLFEPQIKHFGASRTVIVGNHARQSSVEMIAADILGQAPPQFALAGLSMGGYVALEVVRQARDRVTRLALLDTSARADTDEQRATRRRLIEMAEAEGVRKVQQVLLSRLIHQDARADKALVEEILQMADDTGVDAHERQQTAIMRRPDSRLSLSGIHVPTLVLVGRDDVITPIALAEEMHAGIAGCRLEIIDGCGHLSTMERPDAVTAALERWLAEPASVE